MRTSVDLGPEMRRRVEAIVARTAQAHGATASVSYTREFGTTVNDAAATAAAAGAAREVVGADRCDAASAPIMASEDFGLYAAYVPANFTLIGNGQPGEAGGVPLHSHDYDFNDAILPVGVAYYRAVARRVLAG